MGDDLRLKERNSIRTPMQWTNQGNAGFSNAPRNKLFRPVISGGKFGYEKVNVEAQQRDPDSLLNFIERCIRARKQCPEFGWGTWKPIDCTDAAVFAHAVIWKDRTIIAVHNLGAKATKLQLDLSDFHADRATDILGNRDDMPIKKGALQIDLEPYDHRWLRLCGECI
jgi:maltose alpha-D-glucosyltransferase/alpha-amylase